MRLVLGGWDGCCGGLVLTQLVSFNFVSPLRWLAIACHGRRMRTAVKGRQELEEPRAETPFSVKQRCALLTKALGQRVAQIRM